MSKLTTIEPTFAVYDYQLGRVAEYIGAMSAAVDQNRAAVPVFVESAIVVMAARLEHFPTSLFASAVHQREGAVREHFRHRGNDEERVRAEACDRRALIQMVRRRINFKSGGRGIERMCQVLFGFAPWPDRDVYELICDLVLLRNVFVHEGEAVLADHATQAYRSGLFTSKSYGEFTVYRVDYGHALILLRDATVGLKRQVEYIRAELFSRPEWTYGASL